MTLLRLRAKCVDQAALSVTPPDRHFLSYIDVPFSMEQGGEPTNI